MKDLNYKIIIVGGLIDIVGTTLGQILLTNVTSDFYILIAGGSVMSVLAGYYVVMNNGKKIDNNLFALSLLTFLAGFGILVSQGTHMTPQVFWLFLTPILNLIGGLLAKK